MDTRNMISMQEGIKAGWDVLDEILKTTSAYRLAMDLRVSYTQVRNWKKRIHAPSMENFHRLQSYRLFAQQRYRYSTYKG